MPFLSRVKTYSKLSLIASLFVIYAYNRSMACSCVGQIKLNEEFNKRNLVVKAKVVRVDTVTLTSLDPRLAMDIKIKRVYVQVSSNYKKSKADKKFICVYTGLGKGDCGYPFEIGSEYVLFLDVVKSVLNGRLQKTSKFLYTDLCFKTEEWSEMLDQELLTLRKK